MLELFFENIAYRKRNENDLSDITWATCYTSHSFQSLFLNFFFPDVMFNNITRFEREKAEGDSRPDFLIENDDLIYLIECKIYDSNHHFEQYVETFNIPNERLGYITNYHMTKEGFTVNTWEQFYDEILKKLPKDEYEKKLWVGYSLYLKNVCSIIKITQDMDLKGMYSLYSFNEIIKKIVNRDEPDFELSYYSNKNIQGGTGISGNFFQIKYKNVEINDTWAWIGVYYERETPLICIGFENKDGWGKPVFDLINSNSNQLNNGKYTTLPYLNSGSIWFELTKEKHNEFQTCNLDMQIQMLKDFLDEVIKFPLNILKKPI